MDFYWLYECRAIYLLWCMEWSKTFNEVSGHYKNSIITTWFAVCRIENCGRKWSICIGNANGLQWNMNGPSYNGKLLLVTWHKVTSWITSCVNYAKVSRTLPQRKVGFHGLCRHWHLQSRQSCIALSAPRLTIYYNHNLEVISIYENGYRKDMTCVLIRQKFMVTWLSVTIITWLSRSMESGLRFLFCFDYMEIRLQRKHHLSVLEISD